MLSIPELADSGDDGMPLQLPEDVKEVMTGSTYILLNKTDLCSVEDRAKTERALAALLSGSASNERCAADASERSEETGGCGKIWSVSLTCGEGLDRFVSEFGRALGDR